MIFRNKDGRLVEINPFHYKNDALCYRQIVLLKKEFLNKQNKQENERNPDVLQQMGHAPKEYDAED